MDEGRQRLMSHGSGSRRQPTWRTVLIVQVIFTGSILVTYIAFLIRLYTNLEVTHGMAEIFAGDCSEASRVASYSYFLSNTFSVLLFAVGAYANQILLSPTRAEVDNAHARERWVHVGLGSLRNMKWIHRRRLLRVMILMVAAIMLPFLHNSAIYRTLATTDKMAALVTEEYLKGTRLEGSTAQSAFLAKAKQYRNVSLHSQLETIDYDGVLQQMRVDLTNLVHLPPEDCRSLYSSRELPSQLSNVLLISSSNNSNSLDGFVDGDLQYPEMVPNFRQADTSMINWFTANGTIAIFHNHCADTDFDFGTGSIWNIPVWDYYCTPLSYPVEYCLAQKFEPECGVNINARILFGIVVCLFVEFTCLTHMVFSRGFRPLATVGDAVASFMKHSDPMATKSPGLAAISVHSPTSRFDKFGFRRSERDISSWQSKWPVWRAAIDTEMCALFVNCLYLAFFGVSTAILILYNSGSMSDYKPLTLQTPTSARGLLPNQMGLGSIHLVISLIYLFYNHLWSRMLAAAQLNQHVDVQAPLRVTLPTRNARNTYYLNIKPHFSALLIAAMVFVHFMTTRALNVVAVTTYDVTGDYSHQRITYGVSTTSAVLVLVLGFLLLGALAFAMDRKLDDRMPVLGTCSLAIAAACSADDGNTLLGPVKYAKNRRTGSMEFSYQ